MFTALSRCEMNPKSQSAGCRALPIADGDGAQFTKQKAARKAGPRKGMKQNGGPISLASQHEQENQGQPKRCDHHGGDLSANVVVSQPNWKQQIPVYSGQTRQPRSAGLDLLAARTLKALPSPPTLRRWGRSN
jgi:hypothetical protein